MKFSFLTIVFNGDDFLYESLQSVYDFAHEIFIVEGATKDALGMGNVDGSSTDSTLDIIRGFPDGKGKIRMIQGKWKGKEQMTNAPIKEVTGDYIWRLDADEVYKRGDLEKIASLLRDRPEVTHVRILATDFFHGFDRIMVRKNRGLPYEADRIWKYEKGCYFVGHRPPDLYNPATRKFVGKGPTITGEELYRRYGITFYHYSYVTEKQVREKMFFMTNVYLRHFDVGIPLWSIIRHFPGLRFIYRLIFRLSLFDNLRKRRSFPQMNFNYYDNVWMPWIRDREKVEEIYGVSFNSAEPYVSVPFHGTHPEGLEEKIRRMSRCALTGNGTLLV